MSEGYVGRNICRRHRFGNVELFLADAQLAGQRAFVDVFSAFENFACTSIRRLAGPWGQVQISHVEELIVERVLVSTGTIR